MKIRNIINTFALVFLFVVIGGVSTARGQSNAENGPYRNEAQRNESGIGLFRQSNTQEIELDLADAKLYRSLRTSKAVIDSDQQCGIEIKKASQTDQQLKRLNQNRSIQPRQYEVEARRIKNANTRAIKNYKICFSQFLLRIPDMAANGVSSYDAHKAKFEALHRKLGKIGDLDEYIAELERRLERGAPAGIARIDSVSGDGQIKRRGSSHWLPLATGAEVKEGDTIRTGQLSYMRIKYTPDDTDTAPVIQDVGSNSELILDPHIYRMTPRKPRGGLVRGVIRVIFNPVRRGAVYMLRAGLSVLGVKGTEVAVSYDPGTGVAKYTLDHGDAYVEAGGRRVNLQPRTSVRVTANSISRPQVVSQSQWNRLVAATGGDGSATPHRGVQAIGGARQTMPTESQPREYAAVPERNPGPPQQQLSESESERITNGFRAMTALLPRWVAESYFKSLTELDFARVLSNSTGPLRAFHRAYMFQAPLPELAGNSFIGVKSRCSVCDLPGERCEVLVELEELIDRSVSTKSVMATVSKDDRRKSKVSAVAMATPASLSAFHARQPFCE